MNELDSFMNLTELTDDEDLDIASIFGDPSPAQPPPSEPAAAQQACPVQAAEPEAPQNAPALDFFSALTTEQQPQKTTAPADPKAQVSLFDKPPVFSYGGVKENMLISTVFQIRRPTGFCPAAIIFTGFPFSRRPKMQLPESRILCRHVTPRTPICCHI